MINPAVGWELLAWSHCVCLVFVQSEIYFLWKCYLGQCPCWMTCPWLKSEEVFGKAWRGDFTNTDSYICKINLYSAFSPFAFHKQPLELLYKGRCSWNFAKLTGNPCVRASFLIKLQAWMFSSKFCKIFKKTFFTEHLWTAAFDFFIKKLS